MTRRRLLPMACLAVGLAGACAGGSTDRSDLPPAPVGTTAAATAIERTGTSTTAPVAPQRLRAVVVARYPHDPAAFTQGLELAGGELFESTGIEGRSEVRQVDLVTGAVRRRWPMPDDVFGEGVAAVGDRLVALTWRSGTAYVLDRATLTPIRSVRYEGEGWGLCHDGTAVIQSDGTARLTRRDPLTFAALSTVTVRDGTVPVTRLNELECTGGSVYANVWQTTRIARIDPTTGAVTAWIDAGSLVPDRAGTDPDDVLNGIAHDPADGTFLLTGKRWDVLYRVRFEP